MNWYLAAWRKFAVFTGRSRRKEYWFFALFNFIALLLLATADYATGTLDEEMGVGLLSGIYTLAAIIPSIEGWARITGYNTIFIDDRDPYKHGFQVI